MFYARSQKDSRNPYDEKMGAVLYDSCCMRHKNRCIVYVLSRSEERITYFMSAPFKKTVFNTVSFRNEYPLPAEYDELDIDNNSIWGQLSAHIRLIYNLPDYEIVGFGQYRRTFASKNLLRRLVRLPMSQREICEALNTKDAIITSYYVSEGYTAFENFERYRGGANAIASIMVKLYPFFRSDIEIMKKTPGAFWNGPNIIAKRDYLLEYYRMLIPFLKECYLYYKEAGDIKNRNRYLDYCGELFFAVYHFRQTRLYDNLFFKKFIQYRDYGKILKRWSNAVRN